MIKAIRNMRLKKAVVFLFLVVVITGAAAFVLMRLRGEIIKATLNYFIQERVSQTLGAKVTMDSVKTNLFGATVLKSFTVIKETPEDTPFIFKSEKFIIYNNIPQVFFDRIFKRAGFNGINLVFKIENGRLLKGEKSIFENITGFGKIVNNNLVFDDISGKCYNFPLSVHGKVSGETSRFDLSLKFNSSWEFYFAGRVNFAKKRFYAELKKKPSVTDLATTKDIVNIVGDFSEKGRFETSAFFDHVDIGGLDLETQLDIKLDFIGINSVKGNVKTSGTILDYRPFDELECDFLIERGVLRITRLVLGEDYDLVGTVELYKPHKIDLVLRGGKGKLGNIDYESMVVNLIGNSPLLKVVDSRILRKQGYIDISGEVDLRKLWSRNPASGLNWTCGNEAIVWQGWNIVKETNSKEIEMGKGAGKQNEFMVTFKSYLNDEQSWQDSQGHNQDQMVAVEYSLDKQKSVKMQMKSSEEIVSLEHKVRF